MIWVHFTYKSIRIFACCGCLCGRQMFEAELHDYVRIFITEYVELWLLTHGVKLVHGGWVCVYVSVWGRRMGVGRCGTPQTADK